jgi:hypothetical protein
MLIYRYYRLAVYCLVGEAYLVNFRRKMQPSVMQAEGTFVMRDPRCAELGPGASWDRFLSRWLSRLPRRQHEKIVDIFETLLVGRQSKANRHYLFL